jgi:hypothetical protein
MTQVMEQLPNKHKAWVQTPSSPKQSKTKQSNGLTGMGQHWKIMLSENSKCKKYVKYNVIYVRYKSTYCKQTVYDYTYSRHTGSGIFEELERNKSFNYNYKAYFLWKDSEAKMIFTSKTLTLGGKNGFNKVTIRNYFIFIFSSKF